MENEVNAVHYFTGEYRTTIVASVNVGRDWAVYLGATPIAALSNEGATDYIRKHGDKVSESVARAFFPNVTEVYRN